MRRIALILSTVLMTAYLSSCGGGNPPPATPTGAASLTVYSIAFGSFSIGSTSPAQTVTLTNNGGAALSISSINASTNFAQTNTCGGSVAVGANCTISITFSPTVAGDLAGSITITDSALGGPQIISLSGTGKAGVTIAGTIIKSGVSGATVTVYAINADGSNGAVLGTGTTNPDGTFTVNLSTLPTGPVRVVATGGTYVSEWDGTTVTSSSTTTAIVDDASTGASGLDVSAVSSFIDSLASKDLKDGKFSSMHDSHASAEAVIVGFYGFAPGSTVETLMPSLVKTDISSKPDAVRLALILGTLAEEGKLLLPSDPDALIDALIADISDGIWDGKKSGSDVPLGGGHLPSTAGTSDFLSDLAAFVESSTATETAGITPTDTSSLNGSVDTSVSTCTCTPAAVGLTATSSGAINSLAFGGKQYLFVAAHTEGVVVVDITDPTATAPAIKAWTGIFSNAPGSGGFGSIEVGGVVPFVGLAGHPQVGAFAYNSKHFIVLNANTLVSGNPLTDNPVDAEMDVPIAATSPVGFSGGSAYIAGGIPLGGSLLALSTADGYMVFDASQVPSGTPVVKVYPVDDPFGIIAENMGADIQHSTILGGYYGGVQLLDLSGGVSSGASYYITASSTTPTFSTAFPGTFSTTVDGNSADSALQVGILTFEDTQDTELFNLATITKTPSTTTGVLSTFAPATGGTAHVTFCSSCFMQISGSAVDATTHLAQFMAGYSTDLVAGSIQDPNSVASGGTWQGLSDWAFLNINTNTALSTYSYATDPHADGVVYNLLKGQTYGYVLDGSFHGVVQTDLAGLMAITRAGTTGDAAHQPGTDPTTVTNTTTGGKVMQEYTW